MTIEEAIKVAVEMNAWYRSESDNGFTDPQPHDTEKCCLANDVLIAHAKRTTWQPIETMSEEEADVFLCIHNGIFVTNAVRPAGGQEWYITRSPAVGPMEDPRGGWYQYWMPAINPPKESK